MNMKEKDADLFTEGAIYYYENRTNSKKDYKDDTLNHDFLVSRPVYILKKNETPFDEFTINVLVITSSVRRIGIDININGYKNGKILPYNIRSVHKEYLTKYLGHATPEIMEKVDKAVKYHMKYSQDKPEYLIEYEEQEKYRKKLLASLTLKEKGVYDFIQSKCLFRDIFYVGFDELFKAYAKDTKENVYARPQDFSRCLNNIMKEFPDVSRDDSNHIITYHGMSLNGNVHKKDASEGSKQKRDFVDDSSFIEQDADLELLTNDQLFNLLDKKSKKVWSRLGLLEKLDNYNKSPNELQIENYDGTDGRIIKRMILNDVNLKKLKILHVLDNGANPLALNTLNQYVLFVCSNEEILDHISHRYLKNGGIKKLRNQLRNNVKHYFKKI